MAATETIPECPQSGAVRLLHCRGLDPRTAPSSVVAVFVRRLQRVIWYFDFEDFEPSLLPLTSRSSVLLFSGDVGNISRVASQHKEDGWEHDDCHCLVQKAFFQSVVPFEVRKPTRWFPGASFALRFGIRVGVLRKGRRAIMQQSIGVVLHTIIAHV